jgi:hypothetical protein
VSVASPGAQKGRAGSFWLFSVLLAVLLLRAAAAVAAPATFTWPLNGAVDVDSSQNIRWTAVAGAQAYYLYVGSTPGSKDLINSGEISATEFSAVSLPAGRRVYARIHTLSNGRWEAADISFTLHAAAVFRSPAAGSTILSSVSFQWTTVEGAQAYYLYVGTTAGAKDLVDSGETQATSLSVRLPAGGRTVYARLHTMVNGIWRSIDATYQVAPIAVLSQPLDGATDVDPRTVLRWTQIEEAEAYYLYAGTAPGRKDLINSGETQETEWSALSLPAGQAVHVRLHTKVGGVWRYSESQFSLRPMAVFLSPYDGDLDVDPRTRLTWSSVPGAQAYYLYVGTYLGANDLINSGETTRLEWQMLTLPRATPLYARLHTWYEGEWRSVDIMFQLSPVAVLSDPLDGALNVDTRNPLRWTPVVGAEAYYLYVGTTPGARNLINSGELQVTQYSIRSLPPGTKVHVRLHTKFSGRWRSVDTTITTNALAYLIGYSGNTGVLEADRPLSWLALSGAQAYFVYVGSAPGLQDLASSGELTGTSYTIPAHLASNFPTDGTVYVRFHTLYGGLWRYVDYTFTVLTKALLSLPVAAAENVDVTGIRFQWSPMSTAQAYYLYVGTQPGLKDIVNTGETTKLFWDSNTLPGGKVLYARIWTKVGGSWRYADSTFSTRAASALVYPHNGQRSVTLDRNFSWTSVDGVDAYRVTFGVTPGGADLHDSGVIASTQIAPPALPSAGAIYGRVWARKGGIWRFSDAIFTRQTTVASATLENPSGQFDAADGFRWQPVPFAASYRLLLGSAPAASDILDTGQIEATRRYVQGLTVGATVHATLITRLLDGNEVSRATSFLVTQENVTFENRLDAVRSLVAEVRAMALIDNIPKPNTTLLIPVRQHVHETANCTDYTVALLILMTDANVGLPARVLNTCLNPNLYDCHTLVEFQNSDGRWIVADPTFGLLARRDADGELAGAIDIELATRALDWAAIDYELVTPDGTAFAEDYYLDYPLLFLNVLEPAPASDYLLPLESPLSFFDNVGTGPVSGGDYAIRCLAGQDEVTILVDGSARNVLCEPGIDGISQVLTVDTLEIPISTGPVHVLKPRRFLY